MPLAGLGGRHALGTLIVAVAVPLEKTAAVAEGFGVGVEVAGRTAAVASGSGLASERDY